MAPSPEEVTDRTELSNGKAKILINFIKSNTEKNDPDHLLAKGIEKRIRDGHPNWEESQALKQVYHTVLTTSRKKAPKFEAEYEFFCSAAEGN
ncbi:hypothetical protein DSO57_1002133 [Entomophthora muscae]|uniref:Uncharacterized protein n=1 Tax=Entomophthora muscae TaxID=34485 RepID=A0ACC2TWL6_9FUNG|nr:hypothetical protein DSO57_1002133 [Entomophthora muscae]